MCRGADVQMCIQMCFLTADVTVLMESLGMLMESVDVHTESVSYRCTHGERIVIVQEARQRVS